MTNRLKSEHLEKLIEKVKDKMIRSTIVDGDKNRHIAHVCVVCDCLIIGMEKVEIIEKQQLLINSAKLSVSSYEEYYDGVPLHPELVRQYQVDDDDLKHLLLSPRSRLHQNGYDYCESCYRSLIVTKKGEH